MFCEKCGKKISETVSFCPYCGNAIPARGGVAGSEYRGREPFQHAGRNSRGQKPEAKKKRTGVFVIAAAAAAAAVILGIWRSGSTSEPAGYTETEDLVRAYIGAVFDGDGETALDLMSGDVFEAYYGTVSEGMSREEIADDLAETFEASVSSLVSGLGDDWSYTYDILGEWDLELDSTEDEESEISPESVDMGEGKRETVFIQITDEDGTLVAGGKTVLPVLKINDRWTLGSFYTMADSSGDTRQVFTEVPVSAGNPSINGSSESAVRAYVETFFSGDAEAFLKANRWEDIIAYDLENGAADSREEMEYIYLESKRKEMDALAAYMGQGSTYSYDITAQRSADANAVRLENERFIDELADRIIVEDESYITVALHMERNGASQNFTWDFTAAKVNGAWYVLREGLPETID